MSAVAENDTLHPSDGDPETASANSGSRRESVPLTQSFAPSGLHTRIRSAFRRPAVNAILSVSDSSISANVSV